MHKEFGLSKVDAIRAYEFVCLILTMETDEYFGKELGYRPWSHMQDLANGKSVEDIVAKWWPEAG